MGRASFFERSVSSSSPVARGRPTRTRFTSKRSARSVATAIRESTLAARDSLLLHLETFLRRGLQVLSRAYDGPAYGGGMAVSTAPSRSRVAAGYRRILVPVVADAVSVEAVDVACRLAAERHGSITLTTVVEVPPPLPLDAHMDEEDEDAHAVLARAQAIAETYGVDVTPC